LGCAIGCGGYFLAFLVYSNGALLIGLGSCQREIFFRARFTARAKEIALCHPVFKTSAASLVFILTFKTLRVLFTMLSLSYVVFSNE
jgi:hypothetical protein